MDKYNLVMSTPLQWSKFNPAFVLIPHSAGVPKIMSNSSNQTPILSNSAEILGMRKIGSPYSVTVE